MFRTTNFFRKKQNFVTSELTFYLQRSRLGMNGGWGVIGERTENIFGSTFRGQFHQHFTSSFCIFLTKKLQRQTVIREKRCKALSYKKCARKMLMKLTLDRKKNRACYLYTDFVFVGIRN